MSIRNPRAAASGDTMLSDAPMGVPAYLALMSAISRSYWARAPVAKECSCDAKYAASSGSMRV